MTRFEGRRWPHGECNTETIAETFGVASKSKIMQCKDQAYIEFPGIPSCRELRLKHLNDPSHDNQALLEGKKNAFKGHCGQRQADY